MDSDQEQQYQDELNQTRAAENLQKPIWQEMTNEHTGFPWGIFFVAVFFDAIGLFPILNLFTDALAALLLWFWQKHYAPQIDPFLSIFANKIIDICTLGIFPSNISIVIVAYIKKRASAQAPAGEATSGQPEPSAA